MTRTLSTHSRLKGVYPWEHQNNPTPLCDDTNQWLAQIFCLFMRDIRPPYIDPAKDHKRQKKNLQIDSLL